MLFANAQLFFRWNLFIMNASNQISYTTIALWSWLFPITYLIHFAEEYWGGEGYSAYLLRLRGVHLSPARFLTFQLLGFTLVVAGVLIAQQLKFPEFMLVVLGALVLSNGITHTMTAVLHGGYGPGLFSSVLLWIPLGVVTLLGMFGQMSNSRLLIGMATGFAINGIVALLALRGGRLV